MSKQDKDEGARAFGVFLQKIDDGTVHAECSDELHALAKALKDHVVATNQKTKGTFTLKLTFTASPNGTVEVNADISSKPPKKAAHAPGMFWLTRGGNLTPENPKQPDLFPKEVPAAPASVRDIEETKPARSV